MPARSWWLLIVFLALFMGGWVAFVLLAPSTGSLQTATVLKQARDISEFSLVDEYGQPFTKDRFKGHWTLLFAGYTHCPDVCPNTLAVLKSVQQRLPAGVTVETVFLSVDPERDRPENLAQYVDYFDPDFVGITGDKAQIDALCRSLGLYYAIRQDDDEYIVDHSGAVVVIDPEARAKAYFVTPGDIPAMVQDLSTLTSHPPV